MASPLSQLEGVNVYAPIIDRYDLELSPGVQATMMMDFDRDHFDGRDFSQYLPATVILLLCDVGEDFILSRDSDVPGLVCKVLLLRSLGKTCSAHREHYERIGIGKIEAEFDWFGDCEPKTVHLD